MTEQMYQVRDGERVFGPFEKAVLQTLWQTGRIGKAAQVRDEGSDNWRGVEDFLFPKPAAQPAPVKPQPAAAPRPEPERKALVKVQRSRGIYIGLGLLLGVTGAHNLYAGYIPQGVVQFLLSGLGAALLLSGSHIAALGFGVLGIVALWVLVDLFTDKDADGDPLG